MRKIIIILFLLIASFIAVGQPGCPNINAGIDQSLNCVTPCTNLTSTYLATGQTTNYIVSSIPYSPPYPFNTGTALLVNIDDTWSSVINLPFTFCFFGNSYNSIVAGSNGLVTFDLSTANTYCPWSYSSAIPSATSPPPLNSIYGVYHDIDPAVTGDMYYAILGTYPCRTFVVNWNQVAMYSGACNSMLATHQIVLYESTNVIEVYVNNAPLCSSWNSGNKLIGIENATGTLAYTPPGRNTGAWSATNEAWRFTPNGIPNYTISWWQGATQIGTTATINVCPTATTTYTAQIIYTNCNATQVTVTDNVTVNINNIIGLSISPANQVFCSPQAVTFTASCTDPTATYQWSSGSTTASTTVNPTTTTIYTVTATTLACTAQSQVTVTINSSPIIDAGLNTSICLGQSTILNASGGVTYQWSTGQSGSSITVSPSTTTTYTVTGTDINSCTNADNVIVSVNIIPIINAGNDQTICSSTATLTASGGNTYAWSTGQNGVTINVTPATTTIYTVTGTNAGGCTNTDDVTVIVNSTPVVDAGTNQIICQGQTVNLTASGATNYVWSTGQNTQSINVAPAINTIYTVTGTLNGCTASDLVIVTVNLNPIADVGVNTAICAGASINLTASGGGTYLWNTGQALQLINVSPATTTTYTVTVTNNSCTDSDDIIITVNSNPIITAGLDQSICDGSSIALTANGGTTYLWSTGANTQNITVAPNITTTYIVTGTTNGCTNTDDVIITVNLIPSVNAGIDQIICQNQTITLSGSGATSYLWSTGELTQSINVTPIVTTTYTVTGTLNNCTNSDDIVITINLNPTAFAGNDQNICVGNSAIITATGGGTYLWNTTDITQSIAVQPNVTTTYTVTVTLGQCTDSDNITIFVNSLPTAEAGNAVSICVGNSTIITASGGISYYWNTNQNIQSITVQPNSTTLYTVTVTDNNGCTDSDNVLVTVNSLPIITNIDVINETCDMQNGSANAQIQGTQPINVLWSNGQIGSMITNLSYGTYIVTIADANGCTSSQSCNIINLPGPTASFSCHPKVLTLMDNPVLFTDNSTGNIISWDWDLGDGTNAFTTSFDHSYDNFGTYYITLIVTDNNGCQDTIIDSVLVKEIFTMYIPNAFTPNGDGINDYFYPRGLSIDYKEYEMMIFDRWGNMMYYTNVINDMWNGTEDNKYDPLERAVTGVYTYKIRAKEINGALHIFYGKVILLP